MGFDIENPLSNIQELHSDFAILPYLFHVESDHMPSSSYPQILMATDFHVSVRRQTISFISTFSHNFDPSLYYLAVNYLDRFLSTQSIQEGKPWILRLLAVSCVSLAMKMRETDLSVTDLQQDCGFIFDIQTIQRMEFLILGALKWRMRSVTPFAFLSLFISLFKFNDTPSIQALKARAMDIIIKAQNEIKLLEYKPSVVAASALLSASHELFPIQLPCFSRAISSCHSVNEDDLERCYNAMQGIAMEGYESVTEVASSSSTPVNVLDRRFSTTSASYGEETENVAVLPELTVAMSRLQGKDVKRRKVRAWFRTHKGD